MTDKVCKILEQKALAAGIYQIVLEASEIAAEARPGQFVNLYCDNAARLLPRPISICDADAEKGTLTLTQFDCDTKEYSLSAQVTSSQNLKVSTLQFTFEESTNAYEIMLTNFANAILKGEKLICKGEDSENTLSLVNGAYLSAWKGKKVNLPVDIDEYLTALKEAENNE